MITANPYPNVLFLDPQGIKETTIIGEEVNEDVIRTSVVKCQTIDLQKIIGTSLMRKLQQLIAEDTIGDDEYAAYKVLLDEYIQPYLLSLVVADIAFDLSYKFRNKGVITSGDENIGNLSYGDIARLTEKHKVNAAAYREYLTKFLCTNGSNYAELCTSCADGVAPADLQKEFPCPFYLG